MEQPAMDIDLLKSTPDDQIEMMMMMHMNKSAPLASYADATPLISFSDGGGGGGDGGHGIMSQHFNSLSNSSPSSLHPHVTTISFSNNDNNNNASSNNMLLPTTFASYPDIDNNNIKRENNNSNNNNNNFSCYGPSSSGTSSSKQTSMAAMREMIFRIAAMQPIYIDPEAVKPPKRRNVRISKDPQSVAARHRRERISERIRILQRLVPGGTKMDTASMLDEAIHYVKFLKNQVQSLERVAASNNHRHIPPQPPVTTPGLGYFRMTSRGGTSHDAQQFADA